MPAPAPSYRHVLVPLDGSDLAAGALPTARALAERFGATVHATSVGVFDEDADELRVGSARLLGSEPDDPRLHIEVGDDPATSIHGQVERLGSCLVCMSSHGRGRVAGSILGSVARSVLEQGREPMVVVGPMAARPDPDRPGQPLAVGDLLACVDGGAASESVLPVAGAWARALGMALSVVTVAEPVPAPLLADASWHRHHGPDVDVDRYLAELAERWSSSIPDLRTTAVYNPIGVGEGLAQFLDGHPTGLLAVTSHGRSGMRRIRFGSGASEIVHRAPVPVLVVPVSDETVA
jgi:nucleotide-binding universal stress UspA family protein